MEYVVDFDDACDHTLDVTLESLMKLKAAVPNVKVTLFTIPKRSCGKTIDLLKYLNVGHPRDWVAIAPHGWRHTRGECLAWSTEEAVDKIMLARDMGIDAPIFRAPGWLLDADLYEACEKVGHAIAAHRDHYIRHDTVRTYVYNLPYGKKDRVRSIHGHLSNVSGNWIKSMLEDGRLDLPADATYLWPWEAAVVLKPHEVEVAP